MEEHLPGHRTKTVYRKSSKCKLKFCSEAVVMRCIKTSLCSQLERSTLFNFFKKYL